MSTPATITSTLQRFFIGRIPRVAAIADYCAHATLSSSNGLNLDRFFESGRQNAAFSPWTNFPPMKSLYIF